MARKHARPVFYSDEVADELISRMRSGETVVSICEDSHMPVAPTVYEWCKVHGDFGVRFVKAREEQMHIWCDEIVGIFDKAHRTNEVTVDLADIESVATEVSRTKKTVTFRLDRPFLTQAREMVKVRQWIMARVLPTVYGEKLAVTHSHGGLEEKDDAELINDLREAMEGAGITPEQLVSMLTPQGATH